MMIEADVLLGKLHNGDNSLVPIMAHPPKQTSDISFEEFLDTHLRYFKKKGLKLDFKSIEVVEKALIMLKARENEVILLVIVQ